MPERRDNGGNEIKEWKMCQGWTKKNSSNWQNPLTTKEDKRKKRISMPIFIMLKVSRDYQMLPKGKWSQRKI